MATAKVVTQTEESLTSGKYSYSKDRYSRTTTSESNRRNKNKNPGWKSNQSSGYEERPRFKEDARGTIDRIGYRKAVKYENREKH